MNRSGGDVVWRSGALYEAYSKEEVEEFNDDLPPGVRPTKWGSMSAALFRIQEEWEISRSTILSLVTKSKSSMTYRLAERLLSSLHDTEQKRLLKALFTPEIRNARQLYMESLTKATRSLSLGLLGTVVETPPACKPSLGRLSGRHIVVSLPEDTTLPRNGYGGLGGEERRFATRARTLGADDGRVVLASLRVCAMFDSFPRLSDLKLGEIRSLARRCFNAELALIRAECRKYGRLAGDSSRAGELESFQAGSELVAATEGADNGSKGTSARASNNLTQSATPAHISSDYQRAKEKRTRQDTAKLESAKRELERHDAATKNRRKRSR